MSVSPYGTTGVAYDANSLLGQHSAARIMGDIAFLNEERVLQGLAPYPRLTYHFMIAPFR